MKNNFLIMILFLAVLSLSGCMFSTKPNNNVNDLGTNTTAQGAYYDSRPLLYQFDNLTYNYAIALPGQFTLESRSTPDHMIWKDPVADSEKPGNLTHGMIVEVRAVTRGDEQSVEQYLQTQYPHTTVTIVQVAGPAKVSAGQVVESGAVYGITTVVPHGNNFLLVTGWFPDPSYRAISLDAYDDILHHWMP